MSDAYGLVKEAVTWVSLVLGFYLFWKFYKLRDLMDEGTVKLFRQVKSWWGTNQVTERWDKRDKSKAYASGREKIGERIKAMVPLGLLDDLTPEEVHEYVLNPETLKFFQGVGQLFGGLKLPQLPDHVSLPGGGGGAQRRSSSEVPVMRRDE